MKKFYIADAEGQQKGPFDKNELIDFQITSNMLVWYEGLPNWKNASDIWELRELFQVTPPVPQMKQNSTPPPIQNGPNINNQQQNKQVPPPVYQNSQAGVGTLPQIKRLNTHWERAVAFFFDAIIVSAIFYFSIQSYEATILDNKTLSYLISGVFFFIYFCLIEAAQAASWGKMMLGIKIVKKDLTPADFGTVFIRNILKTVFLFIPVVGLILLIPFYGKNQGLHDLIASTCVEYKIKNKK